MIKRLSSIADRVKEKGKVCRIAVAWAQDPNTIAAVAKAVKEGFAHATLVGDKIQIQNVAKSEGVSIDSIPVLHTDSDSAAAEIAVRMVSDGEADILMKGLVGTDKFLKAVMDKEKGLMIPGAVLSYVCALEIPAYNKLLFITDPAVIPFPDLGQKVSMAKYAIEMAGKFGIDSPRIALVGATEKVSSHFESSLHYVKMKEMAGKGEFGKCIMDGPLDIFLACDPKAPETKGVKTPVNGNADILLFPSLESSNPFYKGVMLFAGGELAGLIRGTTKPVVVMSRNESELSKYYCIALACLMA